MDYVSQGDTIVAQATPSGRGGIAVIRVSGSQVQDVITQVLKTSLQPRQATYLNFYDENHEVLDQGIAVFFPNPHSFTGQDVLELQGHGGPVVVELLLQRLVKLGVRIARPGEFSERAFLNDKIDLAQAEAIADLIDANSQQAARSALRSLQGEFSKAILDLNEKIIYLRMYIEAAIDFTDEEIDFLSDDKILKTLTIIIHDLALIQQQSKQGSLLREGITLVIAGQPNVGKSSLLNCLSGKDIAIVTDIPGTTRDVLRNHIHIDGMPIHVIDTAGLRISEDVVEQEGIKRAYHEIQNADIILYVTTATHSQQMALPDTLKDCKQPIVFVRNKIDLLDEQPSVEVNDNRITISLSAKSNLGIELFKNEIKSLVGFNTSNQGIYLARLRHLQAIELAQHYLSQCSLQLNLGCGELAAEDLRQAHLALCEITGQFTTDDLLAKIFSSFCVGK